MYLIEILEIQLKVEIYHSISLFKYLFIHQENELTTFRRDAMKESLLQAQSNQYEKENGELRNQLTQLQGEVYGARLAAKYLDKELAGR